MAKKFASDKPTASEILDLKKPLEAECEILIDPAYAAQLRQLQEELVEVQRANREGKGNLAKGPQAIEKKIEKLQGEASDYIVTFKMRDCGRKRREDLIAAHPPTKQQLDEFRKQGGSGALSFNVETFYPALLAEVTFEPEFTVDQFHRLFDEWGWGEIELLVQTAERVTAGRASIPKYRSATVET